VAGKRAHPCAQVLAQLNRNLVHTYPYTHSYPYDWRLKQPIIIRASQQWFIDVQQLRDRALAYVDEVWSRLRHKFIFRLS
jgi:isoleucyl-tRNA synthetase